MGRTGGQACKEPPRLRAALRSDTHCVRRLVAQLPTPPAHCSVLTALWTAAAWKGVALVCHATCYIAQIYLDLLLHDLHDMHTAIDRHDRSVAGSR